MSDPRQTVVILDDDAAFSKVTATALESTGVAIVCVASVKEALEWLDANAAKTEILAILVDIVMPDTDGLEFIRTLASRGSQTPVIATTGWGELYLRIVREFALGHGLNFVDGMAKPLDYGRLLAHVGALQRNAEELGSEARPRVLAVDDDPVSLEIAASIFDQAGFDVMRANEGFEALELLRTRGPIDLLFTDHEMPGMNGTHLAVEAAKLQANLKIVLTSGRSPEGTSDLPFLKKPYRPDQLVTAVQAIIAVRDSLGLRPSHAI